MEFVEINADRKPRLTGGRRGGNTLEPGRNNISDNLVPATMLPASAGSLADVFHKLGDTMNSPSELMNVGKALKGKGRKCGGATLGQILKNPSEHQTAFDLILKGAKGGKRGRPKKGGAMVQNADGSFTGVGSDDMSWSRMKKGGAYLGPDGKVVVTAKKGYLGASNPGLFHHKMISSGGASNPGLFHHQMIPSGGMVHHAKGFIPRHGHGANTSIGTNYQLSQFGGSMSHPIGNTTPVLSPVLSGMSVGAGRASIPKGKHIKKLLKFMSDAKQHLFPQMKGGDLMGDAWDSIKHIGHELYKEYGSQIFDKGKDLLVDELKKHAHNYITGGSLSGGDFWGDVLDGIKAVASGLWNALQLILNDDVVKEVERDVLHMGVKMAGDYAKQQMASGMSGSGMPGAHGHGIRKIGGKAWYWTDPKTGITYEDPNQGRPTIGGGRPGANGHGIRKIGGDMGDMYSDEIDSVAKSGDVGLINLMRSVLTPSGIKRLDDDLKKYKGSGRPGANGHGVKPKSGGKKPSARGAIVSKIMKEKGLSLPMASKYVKEHGLY